MYSLLIPNDQSSNFNNHIRCIKYHYLKSLKIALANVKKKSCPSGSFIFSLTFQHLQICNALLRAAEAPVFVTFNKSGAIFPISALFLLEFRLR